MRDGEFRHPRLVEVYDAEFGWSREDEFFASFADERALARVLDHGCGTGRLALGLAARGHRVVGVDPAEASIAAARRKPGADRVTWLTGGSDLLPDASFDLALMTSHVAQFVVEDGPWRRLLADLRRSLVPGVTLVFDTRDPADRRWLRWNPDETRRDVPLAGGGSVRTWTEVVSERAGLVTFTHHYAFSDGTGELTSTSTLRFRSLAEVTDSLADAGLVLSAVHGGFDREPVGAPDGELLVVAVRPD